MDILKNIKSLLFSQEHICLFCRESIARDDNYICTDCMDLVEIVNRKIIMNLPNMENAYYSLLYNRFIREKLHAYKFEGKNYLYKAFGEILISTIKTKGLDNKIEVIAFVPAHRRKKALRGYNQSELLASYIADRLEIPLLKNHLLKVKWTKDQNKLGKIERKNNLKDSFKATKTEDFKGKEILLVDDIITTGTTMEECGKVLITNGAKKVYGLALTSSMKM